jgi:hypothetical protein
MCPRHHRLCTTGDGNFNIESTHIFVPIKRYIFGENRAKLMKDVNFLMGEVKIAIDFFNEHDDFEKMDCLARELHKSISGFDNLKSTYESDKLMIGELEVVIDKIRTNIDFIKNTKHQS